MYHIELRQFPYSACRFNLSEQELRATVLDGWVRGEWVELGERKWSPQQARLTVLDGPRLDVQEMAMGRGWRNAQRQGEDVTARLLAGVRARSDSGGASAEPSESGGARAASVYTGGFESKELRPLVEGLALEVVRLLGESPVPLLRAWIEQRQLHPERSPSECLALAEAAVRE